MRKTIISFTAAAIAATAAFAPTASADWTCKSVGGRPLDSTVCVYAHTQEGSTTVDLACSLLNDRAVCAFNPVTAPVGVGPIATTD